jgi:hypothetical protein
MPRIFTLNLNQASGEWVSTNPGALPTQNDNALTPEAVNPNADDATGIVARQNPDTTQPAADADGDAYRVVAFNPRVFPRWGSTWAAGFSFRPITPTASGASCRLSRGGARPTRRWCFATL